MSRPDLALLKGIKIKRPSGQLSRKRFNATCKSVNPLFQKLFCSFTLGICCGLLSSIGSRFFREKFLGLKITALGFFCGLGRSLRSFLQSLFRGTAYLDRVLWVGLSVLPFRPLPPASLSVSGLTSLALADICGAVALEIAWMLIKTPLVALCSSMRQ